MAKPGLLLWKTTQVAESLGLSVSTVKRLIDGGLIQAARTCGKHRLVSPDIVYQYACERGLPLQGELERWVASNRQFGQTASNTVTDSTLVGRLLAALTHGAESEVRAIIQGLVGRAGDSIEIADHLIHPALVQLGEAWRAGTLDIYQEHRASRILEGILLEQNRLFEQKNRETGTPAGPLALGCAPEDDPYTISGLLCEFCLRADGWDVINLGANLPLDSLGRAVEQYRPRMVWLTISHLENPDQFIQSYLNFAEIAARFYVPVVMGGQALGLAIRESLPCAAFGDRIGDLVQFSRLLHPRKVERSVPSLAISQTA